MTIQLTVGTGTNFTTIITKLVTYGLRNYYIIITNTFTNIWIRKQNLPSRSYKLLDWLYFWVQILFFIFENSPYTCHCHHFCSSMFISIMFAPSWVTRLTAFNQNIILLQIFNWNRLLLSHHSKKLLNSFQSWSGGSNSTLLLMIDFRTIKQIRIALLKTLGLTFRD